MIKEELQIDYNYYESEQCSFDDLKVATGKLTVATQSQFEEIKNEKWFNRVFDMVTFSKKNDIRMGDQIGNVAQAQQIMMEILMRLSGRDSKISDLVSESFEKIKRLSENDVLLAKKLKQLENSYLGISKQTDIDELSEAERQILGGLFYDLMNNFDEISEQQRIYANAILNYLDVEAQSIDIRQAMESINNVDRKRKMLTCCMEYGYLNQFNFDYIDSFEDMINDFDFGNKTIRLIKNGIMATNNLRGVNGFIDKYDYDESLEFNEEFIVEFDDEIFEETEDDSEEIEMTEIETDTILNISQGETRIFKNNIVHFHSYINCEGNLIFENCVISYNVSETSDEISLGDGATIKFINCKIICENIDKSYFIQGTGNNEVIIQNCDLINCSYFLKVEKSKILIDNCNISNPCTNLFYVESGEGIISNCHISFSKIPVKNKLLIKDSDKYEAIFNSLNNKSFIIKECKVEGDDIFAKQEDEIKIFSDYPFNDGKYGIMIFKINNGIYENCSFTNLNSCISEALEVRKSMFINCERVIFELGTLYGCNEAKVIDCIFEGCENIVSASSRAIISSCQFLKCKNKIIEGGFYGPISIEFCEFSNITYELSSSFSNRACIQITRPDDKKSCRSTIKKCLFNDVNAGEGLLIEGVVDGKRDWEAVCIENCDFRNCTTKHRSGKLIKVMDYYMNLFKKQVDFVVVDIKDCKGLNNVNKGYNYIEDITLKTKTSTGVPIGATIGDKVGSTLDIIIDLTTEDEVKQSSSNFKIDDEVTSGDNFECISVFLSEINGFVIVNREYEEITPLGMTFRELAHLAGGDFPLKAFVGHDRQSITSKKFMETKGGLTRIVWMPRELKYDIADRLNKVVYEETGIASFTDMVCDETNAIKSELILEFLKKMGHPALEMPPVM